jgi:anti-sigma regulatory factor (Ser/Thr protein kinase)
VPTARFPGRYSSLDAICEFVRDAARAAGLDERAIYDVELAANEGCSNIIDHAYGGESDRPIDCSCEADAAGLTITLRDWGESFDPGSVDEPDFRVPLEQLSLRGAGLRMIRNCMDEVQYRAAPDGGNLLRMRKRL